jgi:hypothetical protein
MPRKAGIDARPPPGAFQTAWHFQPTASQSAKRGEKIMKEKQLKVMG